MKECHESDKKLPKHEVPSRIPSNIANVPKPPKEEVIKMHISRMVKKKVSKKDK